VGVLSLAGINWSDVDVMSEVGVNWACHRLWTHWNDVRL